MLTEPVAGVSDGTIFTTVLGDSSFSVTPSHFDSSSSLLSISFYFSFETQSLVTEAKMEIDGKGEM